MGTGRGSEKIYQLIEELNCSGIDYGSSVVLGELIKYLNRETLEDFVSYFRQNHDMTDEIDDDDTDTLDEEAQSNQFFSSLIPEC